MTARKPFTTEDLLTSPLVFSLTTATDCQRAWWRAGDGLDISAFASNDDVVRAFGGSLPPAGPPPQEFIAVTSIRSAKSMWCAAKAISLSQTVDVSCCSAGDIVRLHVISLTIESTKAVMSHLLAAVLKPALRPLVVGEPSTKGVTLRHPSGRPVEIVPTALAFAGGSAASVWSAGAIIDEAPRMMGAQDAVRNFDDMVTVLRGRLLPNAQVLSIGSPWAQSGPVYDTVNEQHGKHSEDLVIFRATGPQLNPLWFTPQRCQRLLGTPSYQVDVLGEFQDPLAGLLTPSSVRRAVRKGPPMLPAPRHELSLLKAAIDPSELHAGGNAFGFCVMAGELKPAQEGDAPTPHYRVLFAKEWRTGTLSQVFREIAHVLSHYRLSQVATDQYSKQALREIGAREGVDVRYAVKQAADRIRDWESFVTAFDTGCIEIPDDKTLVGDLMAAKRKVTQVSSVIELAHTPDGRHGDLAAAVQMAFSCFRNTKLNIEGRRMPFTDLHKWSEAGFDGAAAREVREKAWTMEEHSDGRLALVRPAVVERTAY